MGMCRDAPITLFDTEMSTGISVQTNTRYSIKPINVIEFDCCGFFQNSTDAILFE